MLIWLGDSDFSVSLFFRFVLDKLLGEFMLDMWLDAKEVDLVPSQAILILEKFFLLIGLSCKKHSASFILCYPYFHVI